jgi:hypothetical protein
MPRHFAKRIYGPYFPFDHNPHDTKNDEKYIENKVEIFFKNLLKMLTFKK